MFGLLSMFSACAVRVYDNVLRLVVTIITLVSEFDIVLAFDDCPFDIPATLADRACGSHQDVFHNRPGAGRRMTGRGGELFDPGSYETRSKSYKYKTMCESGQGRYWTVVVIVLDVLASVLKQVSEKF